MSRFTATLSESPSWCANNHEGHAVFYLWVWLAKTPGPEAGWVELLFASLHTKHTEIRQIYLHYVISCFSRSFYTLSGSEVAYKVWKAEEWQFAEKLINEPLS